MVIENNNYIICGTPYTSELLLVLIFPDGFRACVSGFYPGVLSRGYYSDSQYGHAFIEGLDGGF